MLKIGDEVMVGSRIGANPAVGVVVDIIPANDYRQAMYRVRFKSTSAEVVSLTPRGGCRLFIVRKIHRDYGGRQS